MRCLLCDEPLVIARDVVCPMCGSANRRELGQRLTMITAFAPEIKTQLKNFAAFTRLMREVTCAFADFGRRFGELYAERQDDFEWTRERVMAFVSFYEKHQGESTELWGKDLYEVFIDDCRKAVGKMDTVQPDAEPDGDRPGWESGGP